MIRLFSTIMKGRAHEQADAIAARNAGTILGQQIREAATSLDAARRAMAIAEAGLARDEENLKSIEQRHADLEARVVAAMEKGLHDLARDGAQEIADLEVERDICREGVERMRTEIANRRPYLRQCESRLRRLSRGRDLVTVRSRIQSLSSQAGTSRLATLSEAEGTLARIEDRQAAEDSIQKELSASSSSSVADRLAAAGCGPAAKDSADAVLDRLRARANPPN